MKDLREHWKELRDRLMESPHLAVLTDFDGTLVPFDADLNAPQLSTPIREALEGLARNPRVTMGTVSGRALEDLVPRIGIPNIWYVGNHGYEMRGPGGEERRFYEDEDVEYVALVLREMAQALDRIPDVILERKGPILAVHYRSVDSNRVAEVQRIFLGVIDRHHHRVMIAHGDQVLEARARSGANKGTAVRLILREMPSGTLPIYFGDDITDRDAFRELKGIGVSVEVGGSDSGLADFTLPTPVAVGEVLKRILQELESPGTSVAPMPMKRRRRPD